MAKICMEKSNGHELSPPNGGWGWMVAFGSFLMLALLPMVSLSFSIVFSRFLTERGASSTVVAWIFNMHIFTWNLVGPLTGPLTSEFGFRKVSLLGTAVSSLSFLLIAAVDSIGGLMVLFTLSGMFGGVGCKPCYVLIPQYFDRKRGQAVAILMAGISLGQIAGPPFVRFLLEQYALKGACLIVGAIVFNSCVGAAVFQPVEWHLKPRDDENHPSLLSTDEYEEGSYIGRKEIMFDSPAKCLVPGEVERRALSRGSRHLSECSSVSLAASFIDLTSISPVSRSDNDTVPPGKEYPDGPEVSGTKRALLTVSRLARSLITDLKIFKSFRALIIAIAGVLVTNGYLNFHMMTPFVIQNAGYSLEDAAWCMSIGAVTNLVARLGTSALSDCAWFNMRVVYMIGAGIIAISTLVFSFLSDLTWMKVTIGVWGYGIGTNISLYTLIMPKYMGVENMAAIFGGQSLFMALGHIILGPLIGLVRDVSGSYAVAIQVMAFEVFLCVVLWVFMPLAVAYDKRNVEELASSEEEVAPK
ncbi:hypothetical protein OTU49_005155 [Cherax quadricarinatus]|uniref:Major facilitator superfamily (MFS) profile domain-containing protein n=1 Tax=Cherax quadricarinatus TaxID=27406 RepID=A0AAW0YRC8_CHEQU|nr:monocarboxylate transporter 9-like [Cherax quadricarinatus]XP_053630644.1 monocarboxylate transporter 9-like [Cherax quadricarinatus]XP_053630651.1 monocarboxylate transporter 9-like [Cherax quadricarinatus]XP_053630659.1 monocarboxylate transporter 9-like [Cherax quadricarinatus]